MKLFPSPRPPSADTPLPVGEGITVVNPKHWTDAMRNIFIIIFADSHGKIQNIQP